MSLGDLLEGETLTGRQAAIVFAAFLSLIVLAALLLIVFSDFFRNLVNWTGDPWAVRGSLGVALAAVPAADRPERRHSSRRHFPNGGNHSVSPRASSLTAG
jgi:hypothetical protein